MLAAIRQWVIKTMMKGQTGVVRTLPKNDLIELNTQITAERFMRNGINPEDMKSVGQVENVINQIETPKVNVNPGMTSVKKADVLDMEGNKIPEGSKIIGGKADASSFDEKIDWLVKNVDPDAEQTIPPKFVLQQMLKDGREDLIDHFFEMHTKNIGSKPVIDIDTSGLKNPELVKKMMMDKKLKPTLVNQESDAAIKARLDKSNEEGITSMKNKLDDPEEKADGGRIGLFAGSTKIPAVISRLLKNKKKVDQAVNDIFPTGDYKYDAQMAADAIVENNPKTFKGMLYEDLDMDTQMEVYGAALSGVNKQNALMLQMKKATRPEKTLASMNEGKGINMSDPEIADEFARFIKETDPKGTKELEQKLELENFKTKDRSENADGGRIGLKGGTFLNFLKKFKVKKSGDDVKEFLSKRQFMKDVVGNTEKNKNARQLAEIKAAADEARRNPGFKFKNVDVDKEIRPILDRGLAEALKKNRKLNADGGRIGLSKGGGLLKLLNFFNKKSPYKAGKDYLKYIKDESIKGNSKAVAPGVLTIGGGGILANRFVGRRLEEMNKEQKMEMYEDTKREFIEEYKNDPELLEIMLKNLDDKTFGKVEEKADGGRIGLKGGYLASGAKKLGKKYKGSTLSALLENPKLLGAELGHDGITAIMNFLPNLYADGGRIGLKGGMNKRTFLKLMGSVGASIGAAKSGIFSGFGKGATKQVAKEVAQQTTSSMPPPYFFKLAEKIKNMGTEVTATTDRTISKSLLSKDGNAEYILEESVTSGDTLIKKVYKEKDMITNVEIMSLKKGEDVVTKNGKPVRTPDEYEEVTETNSRVYKDNFNDADYEDGINVDEIIKEVDDQAPPIKYASGGLAYMLGE